MSANFGVLRTLLILVLLAAPLLRAAENPAARADAVIDRWIEAMGGEKRLKALKCSEYRLRHTAANGYGWEVLAQVRSDGSRRSVMQTPGGELVEADDGRVAWVQHVALGGRIIAAEDAERDRRAAGPQESLRAKRDYPQRRRLDDETIDGKTLVVLELVDARGEQEKWWFSSTTGHRVRRETRRKKQLLTTVYSDFRKIDGVTEPFRGETTFPQGDTVSTEVLGVNHKAKPTGEPWSPPPELVADSERIEGILRRHRALLGPEEAVERLTSRRSRTLSTILTNGATVESKLTQKLPNLTLMEQDIPGVGPMVQGFDGKTGWMWSELQGYRQLTGVELGQLLANSDMKAPHLLGENTPLRRWRGEKTETGGRRLAVIELANALGSAGVFYFDLSSGFLVRLESLIPAGPGGSMKVVADIEDYREVDGIRMAHSTRITNPAMQVETQILSIEHNLELADELFAPRKDGKAPVPGSAGGAK